MAKSTKLLALTMTALVCLSPAAQAQSGPASEMPSSRPPVVQQPNRPAAPQVPPGFDPSQSRPYNFPPPNLNFKPREESFGESFLTRLLMGAVAALLAGGAAALRKGKDPSGTK
jgi:hypothetical protein